MPRKSPKLAELRARIADARRMVDIQIGLVARLRAMGKPTLEAEDLLNTYISGLARHDRADTRDRHQTPTHVVVPDDG
jgi:hypothetical protein